MEYSRENAKEFCSGDAISLVLCVNAGDELTRKPASRTGSPPS